MEWGAFASNVMNFGLKNAPATFQWMVIEIFEEFLQSFMRVFINEFSIFGDKSMHLEHVTLCLSKCRFTHSMKCDFYVKRRMVLGHIISADGIAMDPMTKVAIIRLALVPTMPPRA